MKKTILSQTIKNLMICVSAGAALAACGGGAQDTGGSSGSNKLLATINTSCTSTTWSSGVNYGLGTIVFYSANGNYYKETNAGTNGSDGTDPTISTWYWSPYTCSSPTPTPTPTPAGITSGAVYVLTNPNSGKALDINNAGTADGTNVQIWTKNGTAAQNWQVNQNSDGTYTLINPNSGKALDDNGGGSADGTNVQIWTSNSTNAQKWNINSNGDGTYTLINIAANKALDVTGAGTADGTNVEIWTSNSTGAQKWTFTQAGSSGGVGALVSSAQFDQIFPPSGRNSFYTYQGFINAANSIAGFGTTGSSTVQAQEVAAFLANVGHETSSLYYVNEVDQTGNYCASESYGCPAGTYQYYGRGPLQLSWNFNYKAAGDWMGVDLLDTPSLLATDATITWKSAIWYWMTQNGPNTMTAHSAMVNSSGFGQTIRSINGSVECNGQNTAEMNDRVSRYQSIVNLLGVPAGSNLTC